MTDTSALVAFITARLDEDEAIASIITPGGYAPQEWRVTSKPGGWQEIRAFDRTNIEPPSAAGDDGGPPVAVVEGGRLEHVHIARHDPARVLREVQAKRQLLAQYAAVLEEVRAPKSAEHYANARARQFQLELALPLLALPYSDHPDFREEWALPTS